MSSSSADATGTTEPRMVDTAAGPVQCTDRGSGPPVLFVHGTPGGCDQGTVMTEFLVAAGFRAVALSRPGYLATPLDDANRTPDQQAALALALVDALGIDRFGLLCWSGGGPSSYRLAASNPDRVTALAALAAVSGSYTFEHTGEERMLFGGLGRWLMDELVHHAPKQVVKMLATEEGDLTKEQAAELVAHIWDDEAARTFVLDLAGTVTGHRKAGFTNDAAQFPLIDDLGLATLEVPVLLVHGTADSDVPPEQSEHAASLLPHHEILRVENGTHLSAWTDPTSDEIQARVIDHLRA